MKKRLCFLTLALLTVAGLSSWAAQPKTNDGDGPFKIGDTSYNNLEAAINAVEKNGTITMTCDVTNATGISVAKDANKNFTVDFGGHTYTCLDEPAGSTGTTNQVFQLNAGNTITFKNGTIKVADTNKTKFRFIIQNYADLTLENVTIDGTGLSYDADGKGYTYALSNNCGTVNLNGTTSIKASTTSGMNNYAFDVCKYASYDAPTVTWNSTGSVDGTIELSGGNFVLGHNLEVKQPVKVIAPATLNLDNYTLSAASGFTRGTAGVIIVNRKGHLTVKGNANGAVNANNNVYAAVLMTEKDVDTGNTTDPATLTVESGSLIGQQYGITGNGSNGRGNTVITIKGGTVKGTKSDDCAGIYHPQEGTLAINGGTIEGAVGIYVKAGSVTTAVDGGTIKGVGAKDNYSPCTNGFHPTGDAIVFDNCGYPGGEPNATINGGNFISTNGLAIASYATGSYSPISPVINGGTFSDLYGIVYAASGATYKLGNDVAKARGIKIPAGKNFTVDFQNHKYAVECPGAGSSATQTQGFQINSTPSAKSTITFKNGTIECTNANKNATWQSDSPSKGIAMLIQDYADLTLENMTIDGTNIAHNGNNVRYILSSNYGDITLKGNTSIIAPEGDFAFDAYDNKAENDSSYPGAPTVTVNTTGTIEGRVEVTGGNLVVNSGTFSDMSGVNYVADGGTYKLANDVTMSGALNINSGKKFVVDLNEKTLSGRTNIKYGDVTFVNGKINGGSNQALNVYGSSNSSDVNHSVLTVANNVTVTADVFGVCLFGPTASSTVGYGAVANINGTVKTTKDTSSKEGAVFVSGNLGNGKSIEDQAAMEGKNIVNITGSVTSASDAALALNGSATVTIAESASLTGNTAIAAKRGKLVVNGGTITGNGVCVGNPTGNGNGTELTGSALSASSTYGAHLTIDVKGGEFTSAAYTILNNSNDDACTFNISGGNFKTDMATNGIAVYARLGSVNITGGTFENNSNREATLHVGCPTVGSLQPKLTISGAPVVKNNATGSYFYNGEWCPLTVNMANELAYKAVEISGGEFHGQNPEKDDSWTESNTRNTTFLKAGYTVKVSDNVWTVVPENASPVIAKTGDVKITDEDGENIAEVDKEQVTITLTEATNNMTHNTEISLVYEENGLSVANDVVGDDQSVGITVELTGTKVSVTTGGEATVALKEFTFDVTPYVVTTSDKTVVSKIENDQIIAPMTFRLPIPSSVTDSYARVYHKHDGKTTDLGLKEIQGTDPNRFIEISTTSFSEFAVKFTAEKMDIPATLYYYDYYAGNPTRVDGTPENFKTAQTTSTNAIAFVDAKFANWASTQTNVVVKYPAGSNYYYECPEFVLTDLEDFYTPVDFHVVNGSYTRTDTKGLNSVCLPFELSSTDVNNGNIGVFHSTDMYNGDGLNESGNVYFNIVESVASGTPCIIKCSGTDAGWNIDLAGKTVAANPNNVNALKGSYVKETIGEGVYKVDRNGEKFGKTNAGASVTAFRAYLDLTHGNGMDANVKELNIGWADDATGIENVKVASDSKVIYDLTGRMVNNPVKGGLYIINGKKVIFK